MSETLYPLMTNIDEVDQSVCHAVGGIVDRVGDKWTILVIGALANGTMRFNAMLRSIEGTSHRMLTLTLRELERDGLLERRVYPSVPPKVEYELTLLGRSFVQPLFVLVDWTLTNQQAIEAARRDFDARRTNVAE